MLNPCETRIQLHRDRQLELIAQAAQTRLSKEEDAKRPLWLRNRLFSMLARWLEARKLGRARRVNS
jgi:hypothetical protein